MPSGFSEPVYPGRPLESHVHEVSTAPGGYDLLDLVGVLRLLFLLYRIHIDLAEMLALVQELVERVGRVDWFVLFGCIFASVLQDDLGSTGMFGQDCGHAWSVDAPAGSYVSTGWRTYTR